MRKACVWAGVPTTSFVLIALSFMSSDLALASKFRGDTSGGVVLSKVRNGQPAIDLMYKGQPIDANQAAELSSDELSRLDPLPNDTWQPVPHPLSNESEWEYPSEESEFTISSEYDSTKDHFRAAVVSSANGQKYQIRASIHSHAALMMNGLLRRLGYPIPTPKHYSKFRIRFPSIEARKKFFDKMAESIREVKPEERWGVSIPENEPVAILQDVVMQPADIIKVPYYHWGTMVKNSHVNEIRGHRAQRALIVPFVLLDAGERLNIYSWELGRIMDNSVYFPYYRYAASFSGETNYEDARWIARKIAQLTRKDWEQIVALAKYPKEISELVIEKVIARRNHMVELFELWGDLSDDIVKFPYQTNINNSAVKKGKIIKDRFEGCAHVYIETDPLAPLRPMELGRFGMIEGLNYGISEATRRLGEQLTFQSVDDLARKGQQEAIEKMIRNAIANPDKPFEHAVSAWHGPIGGLGFQASRHVITGTYYGSDSKIQLVDAFGYSANVGYFAGFEGFTKMIPGLMANLAIQRHYVHVRPIEVDKLPLDHPNHKEPIKSALTMPWQQIFVQGMLHEIADLVDPEGTELSEADLKLGEKEQKEKRYEKALNQFLSKLKDGEMFIITTSFTPSVGPKVSLPISALLGIDPLGYVANFGLGLQFQVALTHRTTIMRTKNGVQVYQQGMRTGGAEVAADANFWMNIARIAQSYKKGTAHTKAYLASGEDKIKDQDTRVKWVDSFKAVFQDNSTVLMERHFPPYTLDHDISNSLAMGHFLLWAWYDLDEDNCVNVEPPVDAQNRYDPKKNVRTVCASRVVDLMGTDKLSLLSSIINGAFPGRLIPTKQWGINPANSPFGTADWTTVRTEGEVTPGKEKEPVSIIERHKSGWIMTKKQFFKAIDQMEKEAREANMGTPLIRRDDFSSMNQLQMYDIRSVLFVYPEAIEKIKKAVVNVPFKNAVAYLLNLQGRLKEFEIKTTGRREIMFSRARMSPADMRRGVDRVENAQNAYWELEGDTYMAAYHLDHWMRNILEMRRSFPKERKERIKWTTQFVKMLQDSLPLAKLLECFGKENAYYEISISGFRTNDENGDSQYYSSSLGTINFKRRESVIEQIAQATDIKDFILNANWFSEGF